MAARSEHKGWRFVGAVGPGGTAPEIGLPEIAFAGRSNVGKSSLINRLTRTRGLARTSRTPGRTQQVNFFVGPEQVCFADLPGYGFARAPGRVREEWGPLVEQYLRDRGSLRGVVLIVDARRGVGEADRQLLEFLEAYERPCCLVLSKVDKLRQGERVRALRAARAEVGSVVAFSAISGEGERDLWRRLAEFQGLR